MKPNAAQIFDVTPPPASTWWLAVSLSIVLPLGIIIALWLDGHSMHGVWVALVIVPTVGFLLLVTMQRRSVALSAGVLEIRAALHSQRVAIAELDLDRARMVNLAEHIELRPWLKTGGTSLPGFHAGHFRLRKNFGKAFCLLTERSKVLWLPLRDGKSHVLLSLERPQTLLDALRGNS